MAWDSLNTRPLPDAVVHVTAAGRVSEVRRIPVQADGRFVVGDLTTGTWLMALEHPLLDSLGLAPPTKAVTVDGTETMLTLAIPSATTMRRRICGADSAEQGAGILVVRLRDAATDLPVAGGQVRASWIETGIASRRLQRLPRVMADTTDVDGTAFVCDVPSGETILLRGWRGADSSGAVPVDVPETGFARRDLRIAPVRTVTERVRGDSGVMSTVERLVGAATVRGVVRRADGRPVHGARLTITGALSRDTSNSNGSYALTRLPAGSHLLDVRAIGFLPARQPVELRPDAPTTLDVVLEPVMPRLDALYVVGRPGTRMLGLVEFEKRRKRGGGYFYDERALSDFNPAVLTDLLRMTPGVRVPPIGSGGPLTMAGGCSPGIFVDGVPFRGADGFNVDDLVPAFDIRAIEVYTRTVTMPVEYQLYGPLCGAVVVWTGVRSNEGKTTLGGGDARR